MPLISIIVPVYNVEKYVARCIESVLRQTFIDWELLLIDDGSLDSSANICQEYMQKDHRIKLIRKPNGGVSSARNLGLEQMSGEWVMFMDADDWIDDNALEICTRYVTAVDVIKFSVHDIQHNCVKDRSIISTTNRDEYLQQVISRETIVAVNAGLYKAEVVSKCRFNENYNNGEDWLFLANVVNACYSLIVLNVPLYNYERRNEASCTAKMNYSKIESVFNACADIVQCATDFNLNSSIAKAKGNVVYVYFRYISSYMQLKNLKARIKVNRRYYPLRYYFMSVPLRERVTNLLCSTVIGFYLLKAWCKFMAR